MIFPQLSRFLDIALLLMRFMVGAVFMTSGLKDLKNPQERSKDIEMSKGFTIFLGAAELAGGLGGLHSSRRTNFHHPCLARAEPARISSDEKTHTVAIASSYDLSSHRRLG
jgi:hypothetical protein